MRLPVWGAGMGVSGHITHGFRLSQSICKVLTESLFVWVHALLQEGKRFAQTVWSFCCPQPGQIKRAFPIQAGHFLCPFAAPALHTRPARYTGDSLWRWFTVDPFLLLRSLHGLSAGYGICASFRDGASSFRIPVVIRYRQVISFPPPPWGFAEPAFLICQPILFH